MAVQLEATTRILLLVIAGTARKSWSRRLPRRGYRRRHNRHRTNDASEVERAAWLEAHPPRMSGGVLVKHVLDNVEAA